MTGAHCYHYILYSGSQTLWNLELFTVLKETSGTHASACVASQGATDHHCLHWRFNIKYSE